MGRRFLTWLLGVDRGEIAQGAGVRLKLAAVWPTWVILLFAVGAVWLVFFLYSREKGTATRRRKTALAVVRCLIVALVVLVLFKPILAVDKSELKQAYVVVLLDDSLSMSSTDRYRDPEVRLALARVAGLVGKDATRLTASQEAALEKMTRADLVNRVLASKEIDLLGRLYGQCKLRVAAFAESVRGLPVERWRPKEPTPALRVVVPTGKRTLLGAALAESAEALRGHRVAAAIVVSDGRTQDTEPSAIDTARRLGAIHGEPFPVFTVGVGSEDESRDIAVVRILAPTKARKDDQVTFSAVVTSRGFDGEVAVHLNRDGKPVGTERAALRDDGQPQTISIPYTPETVGTFRFTVAIPPQPDEVSTKNNVAQHVLTVKDAKATVLFVSGEPSYFYRYLKNALVVDQSIRLSCLLQSADREFVQEGSLPIARYPASRKELFEYDVVIFSDVDPERFERRQLEDLRAFVAHFGGGFIFVAGQLFPVEQWRGTPLEELLAVKLMGAAPTSDLLTTRSLDEAFQVVLTEQGREHGLMRLGATRPQSLQVWDKLPGCYWYQPVAHSRAGAVVLVQHPYDRDERGAMPLIVAGQNGFGRTLFCALDGTWRWRFWVGDRYFGRFWVQAINFVGTYRLYGGGRRVSVATDRQTYRVGERVVIQARCFDESFRPSKAQAVEAKVEGRSRPPRGVRLARSRDGPGLFQGSFEATRPGEGTVSVSLGPDTDTVGFSVRLPEGEFEHSTMDAATLRAIARATNGAFVRVHEIGQLDGQIRAAAQEITSEVQDPVFDAPLVVVAFLSLICCEWWFRKRGMLA